MNDTTTSTADYVILFSDGRVLYSALEDGQDLSAAIGAHVPDKSTQGQGPIRFWFADDMSDQALTYNPFAESVAQAFGYHHPYGWYGPLAVSAESAGTLPAEIRETVDRAVATVRAEIAEDANPWGPAEIAVPELLHAGYLMHMGAVMCDGRAIQGYKHQVTRRYICLDATGQAWDITHSPTGEASGQRVPLEQALAHLRADDVAHLFADDTTE